MQFIEFERFDSPCTLLKEFSMPWRFIGFVVLCTVFLGFIGLNLENKCDISFGFTKLSEVPVFFTAFASFVLGLLASIPIAISIRVKRNRKQAGKVRVKRGGDSREDVLRERTEPDEKESPYKDDGTYGID
jgi:uncharacterized integral membrane protein